MAVKSSHAVSLGSCNIVHLLHAFSNNQESKMMIFSGKISQHYDDSHHQVITTLSQHYDVSQHQEIPCTVLSGPDLSF